jgi:hypothetical protein
VVVGSKWDLDWFAMSVKVASVGILLMSDHEFAEQQEIRKKLRTLLLSMQTLKEIK